VQDHASIEDQFLDQIHQLIEENPDNERFFPECLEKYLDKG
jgi:hypothetical protein